ncbi:MAG: DegT/DnrJ/EryC1/StrS aminotransferase family protein [Bauldia sp.]|uniref:DegT/DnrJ/EryC1/StrS family aminotransferase n=1 Tax=Bauldia sp. TaxID=2575872 RepID=UPI001DAFDAF1|nr:DegT/DnrJ/EryC1/StrS aminotransferase family protein [Bauldia sp.]MCB1497279.1 DegT/DnrJ/EryC1/StrS aminotransferase family protein [Bauldia sp.]
MAPVGTATVLPAANDDRIALFDLQRQKARLEGEIKARIDAVLNHGQFILGPEVTLLEERLARFAGARHAIAVSSGRDALMIALMAMGVKPGDAVFVPAFTFAATAGSVASIGATPIFVDVDEDSFNMDAAALDEAIVSVSKAGKLVPRVVMPVDLYGLPADYPAIGAVAGRHGLTVLADAAQSFGGELGGRRSGALAPISATSFYPTKPLGCYGDGGAILTEDEGLAEAVRRIRSHGRTGTGDEATELGLTGRLDTIQAAVLLAKLEVFERELARRRAIAARYDKALAAAVTVPTIGEDAESAFALYTIRVRDRDGVKARLDEAGIGTGLFYRLALHQHPAFRDYVGDELPVSERLTGEVLSLPLHPDLTDPEADRVIEAVLAAVRDA